MDKGSTQRDRKLVDLQGALEEARRKKTKADAVRHEIQLATKAAQRDDDNLTATIAQLEAKVADLDTEAKAAKRRKTEDEMGAVARQRFARAVEIDNHLQKAVALIQETLRDGEAMWNLATQIGLTGQHFDSRRSVIGFLTRGLQSDVPARFSKE